MAGLRLGATIHRVAHNHMVPQVMQNTIKGVWKWPVESTHHVADIPIIGVVMVVISVVGRWIFKEPPCGV